MPRFELNGEDVLFPEKPITARDIAIGVFFRYVNGSESKVYLKTAPNLCMDMSNRETYTLRPRSKVVIYTDIVLKTDGAVGEIDDLPPNFSSEVDEGRIPSTRQIGRLGDFDARIIDPEWDDCGGPH